MNPLMIMYSLFGLLFSLLFIGVYFFSKAKKIFSNQKLIVMGLVIAFLFIVLIIGMSSQLNEVHALFLLVLAVFFLMVCQLLVVLMILFKANKRKKRRKKKVKKEVKK